MDNYWILGKSVEIKVSSKMAGYKMNLPFNADPYPKPLAKSARLVYNQIRKPKDIGVSNGCTIGNL